MRDLVFFALHHVVAVHPNLSAIPFNEDKSYPDVCFVRLPHVDLDTCVEFRTRKSPIHQDVESDIELEEVLGQQHCLKFKSHAAGPYWRLIVTSFPDDGQTFTASWFFHHALADGTSAIMFHETFLEGLNQSVQAPTKDVERLVRSPSTSLTPSLEELHPMNISWPFFLSAMAGSLAPGYFKRAPWTGAPITHAPHRLMTRTVILSAKNTSKFVAWCREQKTSVTATLSTLLALAIFSIVDHPVHEINIGMPISLRPVLDLADNSMVNAITNHTATFRRGDVLDGSGSAAIGQVARRVKTELAHEVGKKGADNPIALLKYVSNMHRFFTEKIGTPRDTTAEVSNLGVYRRKVCESRPFHVAPMQSRQLEDKSRLWSIGRMVFSQSANHTGPLVNLSAVTGGDECLVMNFNWPQDLPEDSGSSTERLKLVPGLVEHFVLSLIREGEGKVDQILGIQALKVSVARNEAREGERHIRETSS